MNIATMLKRFWRPKKRLPAATQYPLGLDSAQVNALREFHTSKGYAAFQHVVGELAQHNLSRLLTAEPAKVEYERGALASLNQLYDAIERLLSACEALDDRTRSNGSKHGNRNAFLLGHPLWRADGDER